MPCWPLSTVLVRMLWLRALCGVAEGASVTISSESCVATVLGDAQKRLCILGGRSGMPRSVGSVLGSFVARFLGGFHGKQCRSIPTTGLFRCMTVTRDGAMLLVTGGNRGMHAVHIYCVATSERIRSIGGWGDGPLQFDNPCQIYVAPDDFVFVADFYNNRIQAMTPRFEFHGFVGVGNVKTPVGVCANAEVVAVSELHTCRISVFHRGDGALLRRIGVFGVVDYQLVSLGGLCFMGKKGHIAVHNDSRVAVFSLDGMFVRALETSNDLEFSAVAFSEYGNELVATGGGGVTMFSEHGEMLHSAVLSGFWFNSVAVHDGTIFASRYRNGECLVFR